MPTISRIITNISRKNFSSILELSLLPIKTPGTDPISKAINKFISTVPKLK